MDDVTYSRTGTVRLLGRGGVVDAVEAAGARIVDGPADLLIASLDSEADLALLAEAPDLVVFPPALIDAVAAAAPEAELLCDPSPVELAAALALLLAGRNQGLADSARDREAERLRHLSAEAARIAKALAALSDEIAPAALADRAPGYRGEPAPDPAAETVRAAIRARRLRTRFFDPELFADPAWDMLLDLMAARLEGTPVAVSSLCIAAHVPATTALRWIRALTAQGLFERRADPRDQRRIFIALSEDAARAMAGYFAAVG